MSVKLSFVNTTFTGCIGFRLALVLNQAGSLKAIFQTCLEHYTSYNSSRGAGRGTPPGIVSEGVMPRVDDVGTVEVGTPAVTPKWTITLNGLELASLDRRVVGELTYTYLTFEPPGDGEWDIQSNAPGVAPKHEGDSAGMLRLDTQGHYKPVWDLDTSGKVLSWSADRCGIDDPVGWMFGKTGQRWEALPRFHWSDPAADGTSQQLPANSAVGMLYEELYGRFTSRRRFTARYLENCFANLSGLSTSDLLRCDLDDVILLPAENESAQRYQPNGYVHERVSIVYTNDVAFPTW